MHDHTNAQWQRPQTQAPVNILQRARHGQGARTLSRCFRPMLCCLRTEGDCTHPAWYVSEACPGCAQGGKWAGRCAGAGAGVDSAHVMGQEGVTVVAVVPRHPSPLLRRLHTVGPPAHVSSGPGRSGSGPGRVVKASMQLCRAPPFTCTRPGPAGHITWEIPPKARVRCAHARARACAWRCFPACGSRRPSSRPVRPSSFFCGCSWPCSRNDPIRHRNSWGTDSTQQQGMNGGPGTRAEVRPHSALSSFTATCATWWLRARGRLLLQACCALQRNSADHFLLCMQTARMTLAGRAGAGRRPVWLARGETHDLSERCVSGQPAFRAIGCCVCSVLNKRSCLVKAARQAGARGRAALLLLLLLLSLSLPPSLCMYVRGW